MERRSVRPVAVPAGLWFFSLATVILAMVEAVQIPLGTLPEDNARLATVPVAHFAHVFGGALFGLLGPIQFGRVLARRYGWWHRVMGRVFVLAGAFLVLSSLSLLWRFPDGAAPLVSAGRLVFALLLGFALIRAMQAVRKRNFARHRDWMIRAYAAGIGATAVSMVFLPIYAITGSPPMGVMSDLVFIGSWTGCVVFAEWVIRRVQRAP